MSIRPRPDYSLMGQLYGHRSRYVAGIALLGTYQACQYWFDTWLRRAVDGAFAGQPEQALRLGASLVGVAVLAFGVRVLSRMTMFGAGREAELDVRRMLLEKLHELGPPTARNSARARS